MARRVLACTVAAAIVVARFLVETGAPVPLQGRVAVATPAAHHRTAARSPRASLDGSRTSRSFGIGALIESPVAAFAAPPQTILALVFQPPRAPAPAPLPAPARARDPPLS